MKVSAEKRKRVTGVWRRVRVCVEPEEVVMDDAGLGFLSDGGGVVEEEIGFVRALRKTQFLYTHNQSVNRFDNRFE